jgi:nickel/cobalt exporter
MDIDYNSGMNLTFMAFSLILGGMHALEPGHGKTVVAAYLIGAKGTKLDAVLLGLIVTLTHTSSVIILAVLGKILSSQLQLSDQVLQIYLGILGGVLIFGVGLAMLIQRLQGKDLFHGHSHGHEGHGHGGHQSHGGHDEHEHGHSHNDLPAKEGKQKAAGIGYWRLFLLGVSGGLVPCPAAVTMLVFAASKGKLDAGLTYILLFSIGLAAVLIAIAMAVVSAGKVISGFVDTKRFARKIAIGSASLITLI